MNWRGIEWRWLYRLARLPLLPQAARRRIRDCADRRNLQRVHAAADAAAELCAASGWRGFYGIDKQGQTWELVGYPVDANGDRLPLHAQRLQVGEVAP